MGHNSLYESAYHGVPVVAVPLYADQYPNAKKAELFGLGIAVDHETVDAQQLFETIERVVSEPRQDSERTKDHSFNPPLPLFFLPSFCIPFYLLPSMLSPIDPFLFVTLSPFPSTQPTYAYKHESFLSPPPILSFLPHSLPLSRHLSTHPCIRPAIHPYFMPLQDSPCFILSLLACFLL